MCDTQHFVYKLTHVSCLTDIKIKRKNQGPNRVHHQLFLATNQAAGRGEGARSGQWRVFVSWRPVLCIGQAARPCDRWPNSCVSDFDVQTKLLNLKLAGALYSLFSTSKIFTFADLVIHHFIWKNKTGGYSAFFAAEGVSNGSLYIYCMFLMINTAEWNFSTRDVSLVYDLSLVKNVCRQRIRKIE